jgi:hypothetical protein
MEPACGDAIYWQSANRGTNPMATDTTPPEERAPATADDHVALTGNMSIASMAAGGVTLRSDPPLPLRMLDPAISSNWDQPQPQLPQHSQPFIASSVVTGPTGSAESPARPLGLNGTTVTSTESIPPDGPTGAPPFVQPQWPEPQRPRFLGSEGIIYTPPPLPEEQVAVSVEPNRPTPDVVEFKGLVSGGDVIYSPRVDLHTPQAVQLGLSVTRGSAAAVIRRAVETNPSLQPEHAASKARLFVEAIRSQIAAMPPTPNEPDKLEFHNQLVEFLEGLAAGLSELAETLDKMVANRGNANEPILLGKAATIADHLGNGAMDFIANNREKLAGWMIQGGLIGAATLLAMSLGIDKELLETIAKIFGKGSK